jgi:hypothetical protein
MYSALYLLKNILLKVLVIQYNSSYFLYRNKPCAEMWLEF